MATSTATVVTDDAHRYARQLVSHLGHKVPVSETENGRRLTFDFGTGEVRTEAAALVLIATAAHDEALARVEDVLGRHLERFGRRNELTVAWTRSA
jgi:hypothetical protein